MKKFFAAAVASVVIAGLSLVPAAIAEAVTLKVGATPVPHAQLLELVREDLAAQGVELKIIEFTDYVKPNLALQEGEIDANFFQHLPYLEGFARDHKLDLVSAGSVHVEPLGLYSDKVEKVQDLKKRSIVAIPSDSVNGGRALLLLQANGIIKVDESAGLEATERDIVENPMDLKFKSIEAAQLPRVIRDVGAAVINGNYAIEAGLKPTEDAIVIEGAESPYANIVAVRTGDQSREEIVKLMAALQSDKVKEFILANYDGGVVPAFGPGQE